MQLKDKHIEAIKALGLIFLLTTLAFLVIQWRLEYEVYCFRTNPDSSREIITHYPHIRNINNTYSRTGKDYSLDGSDGSLTMVYDVRVCKPYLNFK